MLPDIQLIINLSLVIKKSFQVLSKCAKNQLTAKVGEIAAGCTKLKPLLIYCSENPRALKNTSKVSLPMIRKLNAKAWVTASLFEDKISQKKFI